MKEVASYAIRLIGWAKARCHQVIAEVGEENSDSVPVIPPSLVHPQTSTSAPKKENLLTGRGVMERIPAPKVKEEITEATADPVAPAQDAEEEEPPCNYDTPETEELNKMIVDSEVKEEPQADSSAPMDTSGSADPVPDVNASGSVDAPTAPSPAAGFGTNSAHMEGPARSPMSLCAYLHVED